MILIFCLFAKFVTFVDSSTTVTTGEEAPPSKIYVTYIYLLLPWLTVQELVKIPIDDCIMELKQINYQTSCLSFHRKYENATPT